MEANYFRNTALIGCAGVALALGAWLCAYAHAKHFDDTLLPGTTMPIALFGVLGYGLIAITALGPHYLVPSAVTMVLTWINHLLVAFAAGFTFYLIIRTMQVKLVCPGCWLCWAANFVFAVRLAFRLIWPAG